MVGSPSSPEESCVAVEVSCPGDLDLQKCISLVQNFVFQEFGLDHLEILTVLHLLWRLPSQTAVVECWGPQQVATVATV